jgi:hypothetical protein
MDPWHNGGSDPWARPQVKCPSDPRSHKPVALAPVVVRGTTIHIYGHREVREVMDLVLANLADKVHITVQSQPGEGWRSKLVQKKLEKQQATQKSKCCDSGHSADREPVGASADKEALSSGRYLRSLSGDKIEAEIKQRLEAVETTLRAQVCVASLTGADVHSSATLVARGDHIMRNSALHSFGNSVPFEELSIADHRRLQRGRRSSSGPSCQAAFDAMVAVDACATYKDAATQSPLERCSVENNVDELLAAYDELYAVVIEVVGNQSAVADTNRVPLAAGVAQTVSDCLLAPPSSARSLPLPPPRLLPPAPSGPPPLPPLPRSLSPVNCSRYRRYEPTD